MLAITGYLHPTFNDKLALDTLEVHCRGRYNLNLKNTFNVGSQDAKVCKPFKEHSQAAALEDFHIRVPKP